MIKRFVIAFLAVYTFNSISGYVIHDVLLHSEYMKLRPVLHSEDINSKIWAFVITSVTGAFFFTLIYSAWKKQGTIAEGLKYGFFIGLWLSINMSLNTYAGTGLIPFSLAMEWFFYYLIQYSLAGVLLAFAYNYKSSEGSS
ncbi:MAG: hypothetical protein JST17_05490 [Bacteroidetes bacterium]|nr:hypothetical protein [Bacteroidota bacterium]MBS1932266.1 hypothetical protein [Bacteroidota bacterium]